MNSSQGPTRWFFSDYLFTMIIWSIAISALQGMKNTPAFTIALHQPITHYTIWINEDLPPRQTRYSPCIAHLRFAIYLAHWFKIVVAENELHC